MGPGLDALPDGWIDVRDRLLTHLRHFGNLGAAPPGDVSLLQGFGAGAEQSGGATLLTETAPLGKRGRLSSLVMVGAALGTVAGALAWAGAHQLTDGALESWGWRAIFWSSIVVTIAAFVTRRKLAESPVFIELKRRWMSSTGRRCRGRPAGRTT